MKLRKPSTSIVVAFVSGHLSLLGILVALHAGRAAAIPPSRNSGGRINQLIAAIPNRIFTSVIEDKLDAKQAAGNPNVVATVIAGDKAKAHTEADGIASAGICGYAHTGVDGIAIANTSGRADEGTRSTAIVRQAGWASAGDEGIAINTLGGDASIFGIGGIAISVEDGGSNSAVSGTTGSLLIIMYTDATGVHYTLGVVGQGNLKPNIRYRLADDHSFHGIGLMPAPIQEDLPCIVLPTPP